MTEEKKPIEVVFAPGCFDEFEGTQEELDAMIKEITDMFANGLPEDADITPLEDLPEEEIQEFLEKMAQSDGPRTLQ